MQEQKSYSNHTLYYTTILTVITLMVIGLVYDNDVELSPGFILHSLFVIILSICLLSYPKRKNTPMKVAIITLSSAYFYSVFFLYPETVTTFTLLCIIPIISILFFNPTLFNFSILLNFISMMVTFMYIRFWDHDNQYAYMKEDLMGNMVNFLLSQLIIYIVYFLAVELHKKEKIYHEQLQQAERLRTTGQLAAAVAHEIRNPLTTVKGFLQLYSYRNAPLSNEQLTLMLDELDTAEQVINEFLQFAKPDTDKKLEMIDINTILQNVTDLLYTYTTSQNNEIQLAMDKNCMILANPIECKQLLMNIMKNALEVSSYGDVITVKTLKKKSYIEIQVVDQGCGMSEEEIQSLGTPFYSLKRNGTGLGLMICSHIVEKYKGTIHFQSVQNEGTTVTIRLPLD